MNTEDSCTVAERYAVNLQKIRRLSAHYFPYSSTDDDSTPSHFVTTGRDSFQKVKGRSYRQPRHHFVPTAQSRTGPSRSQINRVDLQRRLDEDRLNASERLYFTEKVQRRIKEFKHEAASLSESMELDLNRKGIFPSEVNHARSSTMHTVILRSIMTKKLPTYVSEVRNEIKQLRTGRSVKPVSLLDERSQTKHNKELRQDLLARLKQAATNTAGEQSLKHETTEDNEPNLLGRLTYIIKEKLPLRRVKPL
jgi:hypothetical protein